MQEQPLIVTLKIDEKSQAFFDAQRNKYFPPERNFLKAHLTLFHHLPNEQATYDYLTSVAFHQFVLKIQGLKSLGAGVAFEVNSDELLLLRQALSKHFSGALIPQDRQGFCPHITIQNKVNPEQAKTLLEQLDCSFEAFEVKAIGLDIWTYLDGPCRHERTLLFNHF